MATAEELLQIYAIERQDHQMQGTIQFAIVGAGLAYTVLAASALADACIGRGCGPPPPDMLFLAIPLPLFALCGFIVLSASSSLQRAQYLIALEQELQDAITQPKTVRLPTGFRRSQVVWDMTRRRPPHTLRIVNALVYVSMFAIEGGLATWALWLAGERVALAPYVLAVALYVLWLVGQLCAARAGWTDRVIRLADDVGTEAHTRSHPARPRLRA